MTKFIVNNMTDVFKTDVVCFLGSDNKLSRWLREQRINYKTMRLSAYWQSKLVKERLSIPAVAVKITNNYMLLPKFKDQTWSKSALSLETRRDPLGKRTVKDWFPRVASKFDNRFIRELNQATKTTATRTWRSKRFNEQSNSCRRAFLIFVNFFAVLWKTTENVKSPSSASSEAGMRRLSFHISILNWTLPLHI